MTSPAIANHSVNHCAWLYNASMHFRCRVAFFLLISASSFGQPCIQSDFVSTVKGGDSFQQPLGNGLVLHFNPLKDKWGWEIVVSQEDNPGDDWAYPVNPPLRFGNSQYMGTGYGESVRQKLSYRHEIRFLLTKADYSRMSKLAHNALWPSESSQPENAASDYITALKSVPTGTVILTPVDYDRTGSPETVEWMKFTALVIAPPDFTGSSDLHWKARRCELTDLQKGEGKAHACEITCLRQLRG